MKRRDFTLNWRFVILLMVTVLAVPRPRLPKAASAAQPAWWQHAVFYEIYPRSFRDTNGDGIGDLNGITAGLDYLQDLGIDAIWITPFYPSPQVDFGYDISNYEDVDPQFGTLADFDRLLSEAHKRNIRVICDLVANHTSDQHPWFIESRSSRNNPKRDWYIWRDPVNGGPPNNWISTFGGPAWTLDAKTGQYYYHYFYAQQPDLNWRNPEVEKAMLGVVAFWMKRGVDGFRMDALDELYEDPKLRNNPELPALIPGTHTHQQKEIYTRDLPEVHGALQKIRAVSDSFTPPPRVLIGEIWVDKLQQLAEFYGPHNNEVQLPFNFFFTRVSKLSAPEFRTEVLDNQGELRGHWTTYVLSNHDIVRALTRYGDGAHNPRIAKLLAAMTLTLRGTPFIYYGEEIGMENHDPENISEVRDPVGRRFWPAYKGRDGERTPMQWNSGANAGFTTGTPWLKVPASARVQNVEKESADPGSVLNFYKQLIRLRRSSPALLDGQFENLTHSASVFAYARSTARQRVVVALNMTAAPKAVDTTALGAKSYRVLLSNVAGRSKATPSGSLKLKPFEAVILEAVKGM
jgi:alpha-glucosidase